MTNLKKRTQKAGANVQKRIALMPQKIKAPFFIQRKPLSVKFAVWSIICGTLSIWSILAVTQWYGGTLLIGSFGASAVLLFSAPGAEFSQPRSLIGGHLLSALVAVLLVRICGPTMVATGLAVGLAIGIMYLTHTLHPPGGATALIGVLGSAGFDFIFVPVLFGAVILLLNAILVNNLVHHRKYPVVWF